MKENCFVGIDTSNYTTSVAIADEDGRVMCDYIGFCKEMTKYCGAVLTIMTIGNQDIGSKQKYFMHETDHPWGFTDDMIEGPADGEPQDKMVSLNEVCDMLYAMLSTQDINDYDYVTAPAYDTVEDLVEDFRKSFEE